MQIKPCRMDLTLKVMSLYIQLSSVKVQLEILFAFVLIFPQHFHTVWRSVALLYIIIIHKSFDLGQLLQAIPRRVI